MTRVLLLFDICEFVDLGRPLWREDGSVVYNCCWPSPAQSFSGPIPVGLVTVFYCLRFETCLFVASSDSQGHGGGIRPRLHWILDLSTTYVHHSELHFTDQWHSLVSQSITVSTSRFLATASTEGDSSASRTQVLLSQPPVQNFCQLPADLTGSHAVDHFTTTA
jgi:hypothetical protein